MLIRTLRWVALPVAALALVAMAGGGRLDAAGPRQAVAVYTTQQDQAIRASLASRARMRVEESVPPAIPVTEPAVAPEPAPEPVAIVATPPQVAPVAPPRVAPVAPPPPPPATCPANQFCYPRVGIAGTIVPYNDCTGSTDVGTAIRSITCVSPTYLAAHAYTQFGRIAGWRAGDVVFAYGARYIVEGAFTQPGCSPPARAIAPLSLQTSLTPATCGPILVVQARPG
jgi:hypothetical protein